MRYRAMAVGAISAAIFFVAQAGIYPVHGAEEQAGKNLKVLPQEIASGELNRLMMSYSRELGVSCGYCHEQDPDTKAIDYAGDGNPRKATARVMIGMTADINKKYLAQIGDRGYTDPFTCGNCHRGQGKPPAFEPQ